MGNERVINILMAIEAGEDTKRKNEVIAAALRKLKDVRVNKVDVCLERDEIQRKIEERIYDVFICTEILRGETLGGGSIKRWKTVHPHLQVILLVDPNKRSAKKLARLFSEHEYYDALYQDSSVTIQSFHDLIVHPRTREEAFEYYGLREYMEQSEAQQAAAGMTYQQMPQTPPMSETEPMFEVPPMSNGGYVPPQQMNVAPQQGMSFADMAKEAPTEPMYSQNLFMEQPPVAPPPMQPTYQTPPPVMPQTPPMTPPPMPVPPKAENAPIPDVVEQIRMFENQLMNEEAPVIDEAFSQNMGAPVSNSWIEEPVTEEPKEPPMADAFSDSYFEEENTQAEVMEEAGEQTENAALATNMAKSAITAVRGRVATVINDNTLILDHPDGGCLKIAPNTKVILLIEE